MGATGPLPPPGWYPDPAGTPGKSYWDGQRWGSPPSKPPWSRNKIIIGGIAAFAVLLVLLSNCGGGDNPSSSPATSTVTTTITATASPSTVTVTVTATTEAPAPELPTPVWTVPPQTTAQAPPAVPAPLMPQAPASVYYPNCAAARAAGAAPLYVGEPGYRSGLDRDGDGIACE